MVVFARSTPPAPRLLPAPPQHTLVGRSLIDGVRREAYDRIVERLQAGDPHVHVPVGLGARTAFDVVGLVSQDHPELYWAGRRSSFAGAGAFCWVDFPDAVLPAPGQTEALEQAVDAILARIPATAGDYQKARAVYQVMATTLTYDDEVAQGRAQREEAYSMVGMLLHRRAVCMGCVAATQYLLQRCGVTALHVGGVARDGRGSDNHAWLMVRVDGRFYHMDPTWGSSCCAGRPGARRRLVDVAYDYFLLSDAQIATSHTVESAVALPACTDDRGGWYCREGYLVERWDEKAIGAMAARQLGAGRRVVSLQAADAGLYGRLQDLARAPARMGRLLRAVGYRGWGASGYRLTCNERQRTVHMRLE